VVADTVGGTDRDAVDSRCRTSLIVVMTGLIVVMMTGGLIGGD
jgi:hypothetical protein